jgi:hypothetical protein
MEDANNVVRKDTEDEEDLGPGEVPCGVPPEEQKKLEVKLSNNESLLN